MRNCPLCLLALGMALALTGCGEPYRLAADGCTEVPLRGLGEGLPREGAVPPADAGVIDYQALYARHSETDRGVPLIKYYRFWPTGQVLSRGKFGTMRDGRLVTPMTTAADGEVKSDWLMGPGAGGNGVVMPADVGAFNVVGREIHIEYLTRRPGGAVFVVYAGHLTDEGFSLERYWLRSGVIQRWKELPRALKYVREKVGPMEGKPTW